MAYVAPTTRADGYVVPASVWNSDVVNNVIALKALIDGGGAVPAEQTTTATGAQANFDLTARNTYLRCTGAAPVFSGFTVAGAAPQAGDTVVIECLGTTAQVTTEGAGSTAANRVICPSTTGQIVGVNGAIALAYDGTTDRWRQIGVEPGKPVAVTFAAGNFTGNGSMTWTVASGDQTTFTYQQRGKVVTIWLTLTQTTVAGTPNTLLQVALPNSFAATVQADAICMLVDNSTPALAWGSILAAGTTLLISRQDSAAMTAATDATQVRGVFTFEAN